jgi:hypothetical protein
MTRCCHLTQRHWSYCNLIRDDHLFCDVAKVERRLCVVEELESVVSANLQRATRLRQSFLQNAFTGGLV